MNKIAALIPCLLLAACAAPPSGKYVSLDESRSKLPQSSAECLAKKIKPGEPFPASAIPADALRKSQSGWVAVRYDLASGKPENVVVVASNPSGLYDDAAVAHAARYRDPSGTTVRGCVMTIEVKF